MPPKKASKQSVNGSGDQANGSTKSTKRKAEGTTSTQPSKRSRRNAPKKDPEQVLHFLLSPKARDLATPNEELEAIAPNGGLTKYKTYRSPNLSDFEELLCATLISKPFSHRLGLRSIRTLLNAPYRSNTPRALRDAGKERRWNALNDASTQHKEKPALNLGYLAEGVIEGFVEDESDGSMEKLRGKEKRDPEQIRAAIVGIKGCGVTSGILDICEVFRMANIHPAADILFRRLQIQWGELFPAADERALKAVNEHFHLPASSSRALADLVESKWYVLSKEEWGNEKDKNLGIRRVFSTVLDRAVGIETEGKVDDAFAAMQ